MNFLRLEKARWFIIKMDTNKLPLARRTQILAMLCEGSSMRSISRIAEVSINTVSKLLTEAGEACLALHDGHERKSNQANCFRAWSINRQTHRSGRAAGSSRGFQDSLLLEIEFRSNGDADWFDQIALTANLDSTCDATKSRLNWPPLVVSGGGATASDSVL